jgi:ribonuclease HI
VPYISDVGLKELVITACWYIWWQRRQIAHQEPVSSPAKSAQAIQAITTNYYRASKKNARTRIEGWEKPKEGYCKLNVDASFYVETFTGATGAVIRDDHGGFVAGSSCGIPSISDAATAEALALRNGLQLAGQLGCTKIIVNSDCMEVISTMLDGGNSIGAAAAIYEECTFLARNFAHFLFARCGRDSNRVAHTFACKAEGPHTTWLEDPPDFIFELLTNDVLISQQQVFYALFSPPRYLRGLEDF